MKSFHVSVWIFVLVGANCQDYSRVPLGLSNGFVKNDRFYATSQYSPDNYAYTARLKLTGIRWCSALKRSLPVNYSSYVQVDFRNDVTLTGVATQGDDNHYANYPKKYYLEVSSNGNIFTDVKNSAGRRKNFTGNTDNVGIRYNWLESPTRARFVRFRAFDISGGHICVRLEFYGSKDAQAAGKALYSLGMESKVIEDSQLSHSAEINSNPATGGRLNLVDAAWCPPNGNDNEWMQIDFRQPMLITAISTQGHAGSTSKDRTYKYYLKYREVGVSAFVFAKNSSGGNLLFTGNWQFQNLIVMNLLPVPVKTQFLRINPITPGKDSVTRCLRAEVFGYHPDCSVDLMILDSAQLSASSGQSRLLNKGSRIHSKVAWCPSSLSASEYIQINLGAIRRISGFGVQGDSENDKWPTTVKFGVSNCSSATSELTKVFIGSIGRFEVTRHWFKEVIYAQYVRIKPASSNSVAGVCMRVQVLGCPAEITRDYSRVPLGLSNGFVKNDRFYATSQYSPDNYAYTARLKLTGIRWCSALKRSLPVNYSSYVQVDFRNDVTLTGVATQGDDNHYANYPKKYYLEVSSNGRNFATVKNNCVQRQNFTGNTDNVGIKYNWLESPTRARFVRFRAFDISGGHICVRLEFYGSKDAQAAGKALYSLGMESKVIEDSQLSHSAEINSNPATGGRLNLVDAAWCPPNGNDNEWMQIDFRQPMLITAISTQGNGVSTSRDRTFKYYLKYREVGVSAFVFAKNSSGGNLLFTGNWQFQNLIVMNLLPVPVKTQFLRINPITPGKDSVTRCLRAEVFGYHPVCNDDFSTVGVVSASSTATDASKATIYSETSWCALSSDSKMHVVIDLKWPRMVTGIGIQGDSENDNWVKEFKLSHGIERDQLQTLASVFIGNADRNSVVRHWLRPPLFTRYIEIKAHRFNIKACMRVQVLGCLKDHAVLRSISTTVINMRTALVSWDTVYNASSSFTLQYRRTDEGSWSEVPVLKRGSVIVPNLLKFQDYIVRLKSPKGILMMKNYVFGGTFSETSTFKVQIEPGIKLNSNFPPSATYSNITIFWQKPSQEEILNWDVKGINISYNCINDSNGRICDGTKPVQAILTDLESISFHATCLRLFTNYSFSLSMYNSVGKGPKVVVHAKTKERELTVAPVIGSIKMGKSKIEIILKKYVGFNAYGYRVAYRCVESDQSRDCESTKWVNVTSINNFISLNDLISWTKYEMQIKAYNRLGESPVTINFATTEETAPSVPPKGLSTLAINATALRLSWNTLKKNATNGLLTQFSLWLMRIDTSEETAKNVSARLTVAVVNDLKPFANYSVRVAAVNKAGFGPISQAVVQEMPQAAPSGSPAILDIVFGTNYAKVTIKNIDKERENGPLLGYKISYRCVESSITRRCPSSRAEIKTVLGKGEKKLMLHSLASWTKFEVKVNVFNKVGEGDFSSAKNFTTMEFAPGKSPKDVALEVTGSRSLQLKWKHLDWDDRNGLITSFTIQVSSTKTFLRNLSVSSDAESFDITGLLPFSNYSATIAAVNGVGRGPYSDSITVRTREEVPYAAPTISMITNQTFSISLTLKNIKKEFEYGKVLGYHVTYNCIANGDLSRDCASDSDTNETVLGYPKNQLNISRLMSWTKYGVSVQIFNSAGASKSSSVVFGLTQEDNPSSAPQSVKLKVESSRSATITWGPLEKNSTNGRITAYRITLYYLRRRLPQQSLRETSDTRLLIDHLIPYTVYSVSVAAKNSAGYGTESVVTSNRTREDVPSAPQGIKAVPQSSTSIRVTWKEPLDPNGIVRKYTLESCNQRCLNKTFLGVTNHIILENLTTNANYSFKIVAFTIGFGNWSETISQKTVEGIPSEPLNFVITSRGKSSLSLAWNEPAFPRGAFLYYKISGNGSKPYNSTFHQSIDVTYDCDRVCLTSFVLNNLVASTWYVLKIAAVTRIDQGPFSSVINDWTRIAAAPKPRYEVMRKFNNGGTERNVSVKTVSNYYGPIRSYQVIVQIRLADEPPSKSFPQLKSKDEALREKMKYFLATEILPKDMPLTLRFQPGSAMVDALKMELETPGKYFLHFRALSRNNNETVFGNASVLDLERASLKKLPKPLTAGISAFTIKISLQTSLPKGFIPSYYYIIAMRLSANAKIKDSSMYKQEDLDKYDANSRDRPYITAVLTQKEFSGMVEFQVGDGKVTKTQIKRSRRYSRAAEEEFVNQVLEPGARYSFFIRALSSKSKFFSTPWTEAVETRPAPPGKKVQEESNAGALAAGIVVAIVVLAAAAAAFVAVKRKRQELERKHKHEASGFYGEEMKHFESDEHDAETVQKESSCVDSIPAEPKNLKITKNATYPAFSAKNVVQVVNQKITSTDAGFAQEFDEIPKEQLFTWSIGGNPIMKPKNRFANIVPYNYNRVKLQRPQDGTDYINASYIVDYFGTRRYIACQAPVKKTVNDFWTMIVEQKIGIIVMLTRCVEGSKVKSEQYWPLYGTEVYGDIEVSYLGAEEYPDYIFSTFEVKKGTSSRTVNHLHFIAWPDHGVPEHPTSLLSFRRRMRGFSSWEKQGDDLIAVHCSAGVGRTGTFISIDSLIALIQKSRIIDVFSCVELLRRQRSQMVQRESQYKFIYECLLEAAVCGVTEISVQEFRQRYNCLLNDDPSAKHNGFFKEFASLAYVATEIPSEEFSSGRLQANQHKNRDLNALPPNTQRVFLPSLTTEDGCNYINAVFVDGNTRDQFIATQAPLDCTIGHFWRMVVEQGSTTIVSLCEANEEFPIYYPQNGRIQYDDGNITVEYLSKETIRKGLVRTTFAAYDQPFDRSLNEVHHYHLDNWMDHSVPHEAACVVMMIESIESTQRKTNGGPITVHCGNGTGRTGAFIAAYIVLERMKSQQMIDVYQVVRRMKKVRPSFVENEDQYKLIYDVVGTYLEQFSTYSNF